MLSGRKTCTSRTRRMASPGDTFPAFGSVFHVTSVEKAILDDIAQNHFHEEGCESPEQFEVTWAQIHPHAGFNPGQVVWLHKFEMVQ
jgi:hypothetical protein